MEVSPYAFAQEDFLFLLVWLQFFSFKIDFHFKFRFLFQKATVEAVKELIKKHEEFEKRMNANDDKINQMMQFADRLNEENHYASDKITEKARSIDERQVTKILSVRLSVRKSHRSLHYVRSYFSDVQNYF